LVNCIPWATVLDVHNPAVKKFTEWFDNLRDRAGKFRILARLRRVELGNLGDVKALGENLYEMRMTVGLGYRLYYLQRGPALIFLLAGGDKSTQDNDIKRAKEIARTTGNHNEPS
jgi:putative addiction module killer protein